MLAARALYAFVGLAVGALMVACALSWFDGTLIPAHHPSLPTQIAHWCAFLTFEALGAAFAGFCAWAALSPD